ncbi:MAG TPA: lactate racemase domain-containing protein [Victivallales bacterium]|nr:lactate racemase domain-containing protein [Victivallales bacterium]
MKTVDIPVRRWYENTIRKLDFPEIWNVKKILPLGHKKLLLCNSKIGDAVNKPLQGKTLFEIARTKKEAVIVFDDMTRPTPVYDIAPFIVDTLNDAGITDEHIRFIWALGSHAPYDLSYARKKLGVDIVRRFRIYNHDAFIQKNNIKAGTTANGVDVFLNREYMNCDLKIGIESILPHVQAGWSGGGKIVVPGIASLSTVKDFHNSQFSCIKHTGFGKWKQNPMVSIFNEAAEISRLDYKFDCFVNDKGEITDIFSGDPWTTYNEGVKQAREHYGVISDSEKYDIVIANSYAKATEAAISFFLASQIVKKDGVIVLLFDTPEGQVYHYLFGSFGSDYGGLLYTVKNQGEINNYARRLIFNMAYPDQNACDMICNRNDAEIINEWKNVINTLRKDYSAEASVAVINDGTMQYFYS